MTTTVLDKLDKYDENVKSSAKGKRDIVFFSRRRKHELEWYYKLVKYALIAMSILILFFGSAVLISAAYFSTTSVFKLAGLKVAIGIAVIGALITVVACLGCCGSVGESRFVLMGFVGITGLMFFIQMIITGWVFAQRGQLQSLLKAGWDSASNDDRLAVQNTFNCCGFSSFNVDIGDPCPSGATDPCYGAIKGKIDSDWTWLSAAAIIICLFQLITMVLASMLNKGIKKAQAANTVNSAAR